MPQDNKGFVDLRWQERTNDTHESKTGPEARLYRKGTGREAKLSHMGHGFIQNRNGLVVDAEFTAATGTAEREAALTLLKRERGRRTKQAGKAKKEGRRKDRKGRTFTVAADKAYDTRDFVRRCREPGVTPHVAKNEHPRRSSAIDSPTTRHVGYAMSTKARMLCEKTFGWLKTYGAYAAADSQAGRRSSSRSCLGFTALNLLRIAKMTA